MDTAVVTIVMGDHYRKVADLTVPTMRSYADRIGANFIELGVGNGVGYSISPEFEKFQIFGLLNKYRRIIFLDADVIVRPDCPSLFDVVPEDKIGLFNEGAFVDHLTDMSGICKHCEVEVPKWDRQYYNTGVMVVSRQHKFLFDPPEVEIQSACEQYINLQVIKSKTKVFELNYRFNRMQCMDQLTGEDRRASHVIHYAGSRKSQDRRISVIDSDLASWAKMAPKYDYKRHILVKTHGGLGDEICAEPIVRYMVEKAYPGADINVATWFPRLFEHLPVNVFGIDEFKPEFDTPYYVVETLVPPEHPSWKYMSANLMHATDFMSQIALRAILPDDKKQIRLSVKDEDRDEVAGILAPHCLRPGELVLVHPGRGWASKSFPKDYWESVLKYMVEAGLQAVVVGKDISDEQGTVQIDVPDGVMDARNLLSLGGLIALISQARVLVSNDSSPIHIAGAFDNHIILIPTCKHPDHVLAMRNGSRYHKAKALCKKLLVDSIESTPTQVHGQTIDNVVGDIMDYLPEPADVAAEAKRAFEA